MTIDSVGNIYVAETVLNCRVQKFTPEGDVLAVIDHNKEEITYSQVGLCVDSNDILHVASAGTVSMFSTSRQYPGHIDVCWPEFIVSGKLYISSQHGVIICKSYRHYF